VNQAVIKSPRDKDVVALIAIIALGIILYAHTHSAPWYMDDVRAIVENRSLQNLSTVFSEFFSASRGLADITFSVNYHFGKTDTFGYHLVNIIIHLLAACVVYLILKRISPQRLLPALGGALIFVAHPLQTQAVTYIVQRMSSLAGLLFFLAIYLYCRHRETDNRGRVLLWYVAALLCGALAVLTKQNTAVLPLALIVFDRYFLQPNAPLSWRQLIIRALPFAVLPVILGVKHLLLPMADGTGLNDIGGMPDLVHLTHLSPLNYLVTQFTVIWLYIKLLFIPWGQALDYDLPVVAQIFTWQNLIAFAGVIGLFVAAFLLRHRQPLISAGILWFFLGLAVESSIIPLDPVFEHRLYISMFGFALIVMAGLSQLPTKQATVVLVVVISILSTLTWLRNDLWNDPVAFFEDNLRRAPRSERVHLDLANAYVKNDQLAEAQQIYEKALTINPDYVLIHVNLSRVYSMQNEHAKAVAILQDGIRRNPNHFRLHNNLGVIYNFLGRYAEAAGTLTKAVMLENNHATVHFNLALALERLNRLNEAAQHYRRAIMLDPGDAKSYFNLGMVLHKQGDLRGALQQFLLAGQITPNHGSTLYNTALIYLDLGEIASANAMLDRLHQIDPQLASQVRARINRSR